MKHWDSHHRALRSARRVTSVVARGSVRFVLGTALLLAAPACSESTAGAGPGDANGTADVASLFDTILGTDAPGAGDGLSEGETASGESDIVATGDLVGEDGVAAGDVVVAEDVPAAEDVAAVDDASVAADSLDLGDTAAVAVSCYQPTDIACAAPEDCVIADKGAMACVDGLCNEMDFTPNETAAACCQEQYAAGNFAAAGCTPWGPPAPPVDRGYRLDRSALAREAV